MTTRLDDIPLKTIKTPNDNYADDSDDPMVKDILNEFQQELQVNNRHQQPQQAYAPQQSYQPPQAQPPHQPQAPQQANYKINYADNNPKKTKQPFSYYNEEFLKKTAIIILISFLIFSPLFFPFIIEKLPVFAVPIVETYEFYIKLLLLSIIIYGLFLHDFI